MTQEPVQLTGEKISEYQLATLEAIEKHLRSIKGMLTFFTVLAILAILIQGCTALLNY